MNQTFKKSAIAVGVAAAFTFGSGVAAANQFADTTQVATIGAGQNVAKLSAADLGTQSLVLIGNVNGAVSDGTVIVSLDNNAKFKKAIVTADSGISVTANGARVVTSGTNGTDAVASAAAWTGNIVIGGVTFTLTYTNNTAVSTNKDTLVISNSAGVSSRTVTAAAAANNAEEMLTGEAMLGLANAINDVFAPGQTALTADGTAGIVTVANAGNAAGVTITLGTTAAITGGAAGMTKTATGLTLSSNSIPTAFIDSNGALNFAVASDLGTSGVATIRVAGMVLDTSSSSLDTAVNANVSGGTSTGVTTGTQTKLATVKASGVTIANGTTQGGAAQTAAVNITAGGTATIYDIVIAENVPGSIPTGNASANEVKITLPSGWKFAANSNQSYTGTTALVADDPDERNANSMTLDVSTGSTTVAGKITLGGVTAIQVTAPATAALGDAFATVRVYYGTSDTTYSEQQVKIATVVAAGTDTTVVKSTDTTTSLATSALPTVYSGRVYTSGSNNVIPTSSTNETYNTYRLKLAERSAVTLTKNATVTLALGSGKFTDTSVTTGGGVDAAYDFNPGADSSLDLDPATTFLSANNTVATFNVTNVSSGSAGKPTIQLFNGATAQSGIDLRAAAAGALNVTVGGTAGATAQAVQVANIADATSSSVSGAVVTMQATQTGVALPSIVITEAAPKLLSTDQGVRGGTIAIDLPTGFSYASNVASAASVKTTSGATVAIARTSPTRITLTLPSTLSSSVAESITLSGVVVDGSSSASGDVTLSVMGAYGDNTGTTVVSTAQPTYAKLKVGSVVSSTNPSYPSVTVADSTKAVIAGIPLVAAGNDQGKPGSVYVVFIYAGTVFFMDSTGAWTTYTGATPTAYSTGSLGTTSIDVIKTAEDLSSLKGGQLIVGYGLGIAGLGDPFKNMLDNARYNVVYTVK